MKTCSECGATKALADFVKASASKDGRAARCKSCDNARKQRWRAENRDHANAYIREYKQAWNKANPERVQAMHRRTDLKRKYGITVEDYDQMYEAQGGRCAICGAHEHDSKRKYKMSVDHCHKTGAVRALLCNNCNLALGLFGDSQPLLEAALHYLRRHS